MHGQRLDKCVYVFFVCMYACVCNCVRLFMYVCVCAHMYTYILHKNFVKIKYFSQLPNE